MRWRRFSVAVVLGTMLTSFGAASAAADDGGGLITGGKTQGGVVLGGDSASPGKAEPAKTSRPLATRTTTCIPNSDGACQAAIQNCTHAPLPAPPRVVITEQEQADGSWRQTAVDCDGTGANDALAVTPDMVREQVIRLLPPVAVGIAPATGPTLVNMETVFWSPTATTRQLGPVTILNQSVAITIRFDHATYDYGDGTTATTRSPGRPWTKAACDTAQCPTLDGHTYTATADRVTARSTITWTATFTVGNGAAQPIPGTVDGPTSTHDLQVLQGRSVILR